MKFSQDRLILMASALIILFITVSLYDMRDSGRENNNSEGFVSLTDQIEDNGDLKRYGLASLEVDGERRVFVTGFDGPNALMKWSDGKLIDDTPKELKDSETNAIGAAACDIDGDGSEEIYVLTTGGQYGGKKSTADRLYDRKDGEWRDLFSDSDVSNRYSGRSVACTYTPDGYGFFVARYAGPMQLMVMEDNSIIDKAPEYGMDKVTGGRSIVNVPGENGTDLFVGNERGPNFYYQQTEDGYQEKASDLGVAAPDLPARGATAYDMEGDGDFDLAVSNWNSPHKIYENTEKGFKEVMTEEFRRPSPARNLVSGDFDNDGETELFLNNIASRQRAENRYFDSKGNSLSTGEASEPEGLGTGATVADIDGDGNLELILAHGETARQPLTMYENPNDNNSVRVQPVWKSGAPARNSFIRLENGSVYLMDGGSAYLSQMEPWIHLGGLKTPLEIEVIFPDGTIIEKTVEKSTVKIEYPGNQTVK